MQKGGEVRLPRAQLLALWSAVGALTVLVVAVLLPQGRAGDAKQIGDSAGNAAIRPSDAHDLAGLIARIEALEQAARARSLETPAPERRLAFDLEALEAKRGADSNARDDSGQTPLAVAQSRNRADLVALLQRYGAR